MGWWGCHNNQNDQSSDLEALFVERYYIVSENADDSSCCSCSDNYDDYSKIYNLALQDADRFDKLNQFLEGRIRNDYQVGVCFSFIENDKLPENFIEPLRLKIVAYLEQRIKDDASEFRNPDERKEALNKELFIFSRGTKGCMEEDV
jgi:hypothetical protein